MSKKVKVAVIGGGNMGLNHIRKYSELMDVDLVAVVDISPSIKQVAELYNTKFYTDYKEMLDKEKPDAISVVVPTPFHYEVTKEVLNRKIHCLLEKPIASSVKEGIELRELAKNNNVVFTIGHIEHYNPLVVKLKELIDSGALGDIISISCKRVGGFPPIEPKTDVIVDLAVHDVGIISYLLGSNPKNIQSHGSKTLHSSLVDSAEILLGYGCASGIIQVNWVTPIKVRNISVTGSKGYVEGNYLTQDLNFYESNIKKEVDKNFKTFIASLGEPKHHEIKVIFEEPLLKEVKTFIEHVSGHKNNYLVSVDEAIEALRSTLIASEQAKLIAN